MQYLYRQTSFLLSVLLTSLFLSACSSGKDCTSTGRIKGIATQKMHGGVYNPDGADATVSPLSLHPVIVLDADEKRIDSTMTDIHGAFTLDLCAGHYSLLIAPFGEMIESDQDVQKDVTVERGDTTSVRLMVEVYAP